jgi:hypothetical protein
MNRTKWILVVVLIIIVLGIGLYSFNKAQAPQMPSGSMYPVSSSSPTDTSDAAIQQDTTAIDAQIQGVDADNAAVKQGLTVQ